jgi:hypothetical protein
MIFYGFLPKCFLFVFCCCLGYTRGFGFVEFENVEAAKQWMEQIKVRKSIRHQAYSDPVK